VGRRVTQRGVERVMVVEVAGAAAAAAAAL
jgi:hypothetical protein